MNRLGKPKVQIIHKRVPEAVYNNLDIEFMKKNRQTRPNNYHLHEYVEGIGFLGIHDDQKPSEFGGATFVVISFPISNLKIVGKAFCSFQERFSRERGEQIAVGRAKKALNLVMRASECADLDT